jgi:DNA polymerase-3 subunit epsilon
MRIHGISPQALSDAPTFESIAEKIKDMLGDSIIVGHVVEIDLDFLKKSFKNAGIKFDNNAIDIAILEKWLGERLGDRRTDLSLDSLIKVYNLSSRFRHSAIADAFLTAQIFQIQLLKLLKYGMTSVERILSALESARMSRIDFIF